jgi:hypothetical protein
MIFEPTAYRRLARGDRGRGRNFSLAASVFPDVNLIEMPYSKFKAFLRKLAARSRPSAAASYWLFHPRLRPRECTNYFRHSGYVSI